MQEAMRESTSVGHLPAKAQWEFDESVTAVFEDMLNRSIPQYGVMRKLCTDIAAQYHQPGGIIYDLGCSKGDALVSFFDRFGGSSQYIGLEVSKPMIEAVRQRTANLKPYVRIEERDLRDPMTFTNASVMLSVLTLQFVPINYRQKIIDEVYAGLNPGGCFILVEKVMGETTTIDRGMIACYHKMKEVNGYSKHEIDRKAMSLEGVLVPVTDSMNRSLLAKAGFRHVDCFWRYMNFTGYVAVKD